MGIKGFKEIALLSATLVLLSGCGFVEIEPLTQEERAEYIQKDKELREKYLIPIEGPITIYDAMARTMMANIDYRVQAMEEAVANAEFEKAKLEMLPELRGTASYTYRDPEYASISKNIETGEVSTGGYTTSESQSRALGDITFSWNLLDFGLSYYQAKQQADSVLVRQQMQRKVMQTLLFKVRHAYWNAYFAQAFAPQVDDILAETHKALDKLKSSETLRLRPLLDTLRFQRALLGIISQMDALQTELALARVDLLSLMNLPYDTEYTLVAPGNPEEDRFDFELPSMKEMVELALDQRPETQQAMYRSRSSLFEVKKATLKTLPGIELKTAFNFDTNTYLKDNTWYDIWGHLTLNVMDILTAPQRIEAAETNVDLAEYRRLATNLAVISQVQMAVLQYKDSVEHRDQAHEISNIERRISKLVDNEVGSQATNPLQSIRHRGSALFSQLEHYKSFADAHNAYARMLTSMGLDLVPFELTETLDYVELKNNIKEIQEVQDTDINKYMTMYKERLAAEDAALIAERNE